MRSAVDSLVTGSVLHQMNSNSRVWDWIVETPENEGAPEIKNVCAKVHSSLSDKLDSVCQTLGVSKRIFIESALVDAIRVAEKIMREEGFPAPDAFELQEDAMPVIVDVQRG